MRYPVFFSPEAMPLIVRKMACSSPCAFIAALIRQRAVAAQKVDLHKIERINIGVALFDGALQHRLIIEQLMLVGDAQDFRHRLIEGAR